MLKLADGGLTVLTQWDCPIQIRLFARYQWAVQHDQFMWVGVEVMSA
jgi:hypothetical protein